MAACWVIAYHIHGVHGLAFASRELGDRLLSRGYLAVDLFFVLSGFVMALSYGHVVASGWTRRSYGIFLLRRFARIYPLYGLMTSAIIFLLATGLSHDVALSNGVALTNLTLTQAWGLSPSLNPPAWSISTEFAAYLLFPALSLLALRTKGGGALMVALACFAALWSVQWAVAPTGIPDRDGPLDVFWTPGLFPVCRCLSEFTLGLLTWRLSRNRLVQGWLDRTGIALLIIAAFFALLLVPDADVFIVIAMSLVLLVLSRGRNFAARLMESRPFVFAGDISYSLYLIHGPLLRLRRIVSSALEARLGHDGADAAALFVLYGSIILCSCISYFLLEKPFRQKIRQAETTPAARHYRTPPPLTATLTVPAYPAAAPS